MVRNPAVSSQLHREMSALQVSLLQTLKESEQFGPSSTGSGESGDQQGVKNDTALRS